MTSEDLAARLRDWKNVWLQDSDQPDGSLYIEAADALAAAQEKIRFLQGELDTVLAGRSDEADRADKAQDENERLREALEPLAYHPAHRNTAMGRRARAALGKEG